MLIVGHATDPYRPIAAGRGTAASGRGVTNQFVLRRDANKHRSASRNREHRRTQATDDPSPCCRAPTKITISSNDISPPAGRRNRFTNFAEIDWLTVTSKFPMSHPTVAHLVV
jgi:hypothetical protein